MTTPNSGTRRSARDRILRGMMALDDHRSVQEHTVDELAAIAQVAKGSVYYHFGSKEKLVSGILVHGAEELQSIMDDLDTDAVGLSAARESFRAQLRAAFEFLRDYPSFTGLVAFALARRRDDESQQLRREKEAIVMLLASRLRRLGEAEAAEAEGGAAPPRATSSPLQEIAATALLSAAVTLSIDQHTTHPEWSVDECVEVLIRMSVGPLP